MKIAALILCGLFIAVCFLMNPPERECLDSDQVRVILKKAKQLEEQGVLQSALQGYKKIDLYACGHSEEQHYASERGMLIGKDIREAYKLTMELIGVFHGVHGEYPSSLDEVRKNVPNEYIQAFDGFRMVKKDDGSVDIVTGLYGAASFDFN